jgi:hypothetical protein
MTLKPVVPQPTPLRRRRASVPWMYKIYETPNGKEYHYNTCPCARCAASRVAFRALEAEREKERAAYAAKQRAVRRAAAARRRK